MNPKILMVVQDAFFMDALADKLRKQKMSVLTKKSGQGVSDILRSRNIDVVLLDVRFRKEEAMQDLDSVKRLQPEAEVILLSSTDNIAFSMEGMRRGASDDITVPFDVDTLIGKIREACRRKREKTRCKRRRSIFSIFEDAMVAATFAQAGEFESAKEIYSSANNSEEEDTDDDGDKVRRQKKG